MLQENKIQFAALDKAIKAYTSNFGMSLDVVAAKDYKISCKVSFKQKPTSYAVIEIDLDKEQMICKFFNVGSNLFLIFCF